MGYNKDVNTRDYAFPAFVDRKYRLEINEAIANFSYEHSDSFRLKKIETVTKVDCESYEIKKPWIRDLPRLKVEFDFAVEAELVFWGTSDMTEMEEDLSEWFLVTGVVDFEDLDDGFTIVEVQQYDAKYNPRVDFSSTLSPCISEKRAEEIAEEFLRIYFPEVFQEDRPVDVEAIVKRMGLVKIERHLSEDEHIFGQIFFKPSTTKTYPDDSGVPVMEKFKAGTILIDDRVFFLRNYGSERHTIVHECIHWYLHRKKFLLLESMKHAKSGIKCYITGEAQSHDDCEDGWFLEWQANKIASMVLVPEPILRKKVKAYLSAERAEHPGTADVYLMKNVLEKVATFFEVSLQLAKIRMLECGYRIIEGAFDYCNGKSLQTYTFKEGSLKPNETYTIGCQDLIIQSMLNPGLKELIDNQHLVYSDSHLVINDPKYIEGNGRNRRLTEHARLHLDECGIKFTVDTKKGRNGIGYHRECVLCRGFNGPLKAECKFEGIGNEDNISKAKAVIKQQKRINMLEDLIVKSSFTKSFNNLLTVLNFTEEKLAKLSGLSERTIIRLKKGEAKQPPLTTVVSVAIGFDLPYEVSRALLASAGHVLMMGNEEHSLYKFFLSDSCCMTIAECNQMLKDSGYEELNKEKKKNDSV